MKDYELSWEFPKQQGDKYTTFETVRKSSNTFCILQQYFCPVVIYSSTHKLFYPALRNFSNGATIIVPLGVLGYAVPDGIDDENTCDYLLDMVSDFACELSEVHDSIIEWLLTNTECCKYALLEGVR